MLSLSWRLSLLTVFYVILLVSTYNHFLCRWDPIQRSPAVPVDRVSTSSSKGMGPGWVTEEEDPKYENKGHVCLAPGHRLGLAQTLALGRQAPCIC